ncbi:hypothetical protein QRX50_32290 [Amycolatopsis carbonis]|uniref:Uncharacterized protein n=1 Tax=Amycolatopsis carbonis TaxID=715471 RepID=A0A9Y2MUR2_9PSEU|nr:hypothetical protein [Amycolatopsis sp. 2-15]WIX76134.1 hypothetical protein QRX50_32290 [Amycolatopsis sp. 2-15]
MDTLGKLRLEVEAIWGRDDTGLAAGTVFAVITTCDGRSELIAGHEAPDRPTAVTAARSWLLPAAAEAPVAPAGPTLVRERGDLGPSAPPTPVGGLRRPARPSAGQRAAGSCCWPVSAAPGRLSPTEARS